MRLGFNKYSIYCMFPTRQCGHLSQVKEFTKLYDTLDCRIEFVDDIYNYNAFILMSLDILSISNELYVYLKGVIKKMAVIQNYLFQQHIHTMSMTQ